MSRFDTLHPDQQAALKLVLKQQLSYSKLAGLLSLPEEKVRNRVLDAVDGLAPDGPTNLSDEDQDTLTDYLLGQQSVSDRKSSRELLERSPDARAWARSVAAELRPLSNAEIPTIPGDGSDVQEAFRALDDRRTAEQTVAKKSTIGAILIGIVALIAAGLIIYFATKSNGDNKDDSGASSTSQTSGTDTSAEMLEARAYIAKLPAQINFNAPDGAKSPLGVGVPDLAYDKDKKPVASIAFTAQGFKPMTSKRVYAVWLTSKAGRRPVCIGYFPNGSVTSKGDVETTPFPLLDQCNGRPGNPIDPSRYDSVIVTSTNSTADQAKPGETVVSASLAAPTQ